MSGPNLEQTLRNMIQAAKVAAGFYGVLAESTRDAEARAFLEGMVSRERAHAEAIEILALEMTDHSLPAHADNYVDLAHVVSEWRAVDDISYAQALEVVFEASSHAALLYGALADGAPVEARALLEGLAAQQEAHVDRLTALRRGPAVGMWDFRALSPTNVRQGLRNAIRAESAAAGFHTALGARASDRTARIFLEQLALEEEANAEQIEIIVLEKADWALPVDPEPHAETIKVPARLKSPHDVSLPVALEHALYAQTRGARYYRVLASLATGAIAGDLDRFARDQEDHLTQLIARRNTYWSTHADDVPSMRADDVARLAKGHV